MEKLIFLLAMNFLISSSATAQNWVSVEIQKNSSLIITGSSNLLPFKIYQDGDKLSHGKMTIVTTQIQNKIEVSQNQLSVIVKNFASNNAMALRDFLKLLKADSYPTLQVQLNHLDLSPICLKENIQEGEALVNITITGKTKQYSIPVTYNSNGEIFTVNGSKKISIRDFGLKPETKMLGLIKVSEWIDIHFHIICKITPKVGNNNQIMSNLKTKQNYANH